MTLLIAMTPVLELRGAIPAGVAGGLSPLAALLIAAAGNMMPVPLIILSVRHVFSWLRTKGKIGVFAGKIEERAVRKSALVKRYAGLGLLILVAIPLPGTGAWTGAMVAGLMNMRLKRALPVIFCGIMIAGVITTIITFGISHLLG